MTLIVGRVVDEKIYIFGDSRLTFFNKEPANPFVRGCLKQYIVSDSLAVGFSGVREHFEDSYKQILRCTSSDEIVAVAQSSYIQGKSYDLLVAEVGYDKIKFVKEGQLYEAEAGYVGDSEAFAAFQGNYHARGNSQEQAPELGKAHMQMLRIPEPVAENSDPYHLMYLSLKQTIWNEKVASVGGVIVPLCTDKGSFRYMNYVDIVSDPLEAEDFQEEPKAIEFGTAERGGYAVEFSDDSPHGGQGREIGYYFLQGEFGIFFPENRKGFRDAKLVRAENPAYWVLNTSKILGYGISSGLLTEDHCGIAGEKLLQEEQFEDSLFCYQLREDSETLKDRPKQRDRYFAGYATAMFNCGQTGKAIRLLRTEVKKNKHNTICSTYLNKMLHAVGAA